MTTMRSRTLTLFAVVAILLVTPFGRATEGVRLGSRDELPSPQQVLARAGEYIADYGSRMALIIGKEQYSQQLFSTSSARVLESEIALLRVGDDWLGFRDVYEVNGVPVHDRQGRLARLFQTGVGSAVADARRLSDESARYNIGAIVRNFNMPTTALLFLQPNNQARCRFKKSGEQVIDGRKVWRFRFEETRKPTLIRTSAGVNVPASGEFWIAVEDGTVHRSRLELSAEARLTGQSFDMTGLRVRSTASIDVTYQRDDRLALLVPSEMVEAYEGPWVASGGEQSLTRINCRARYSEFKRFETSGRVVPK